MRRALLRAAGAALLTSLLLAQNGGTLYNGIRLPKPWPPRVQQPAQQPLPEPPHLQSPPDVIPIDTGRQLFVDDFLIEETTLRRTFHAATPYAGNPVVSPDKPWEKRGRSGFAMVFSDGVWYDPQDRLYKMWYFGPEATLYAHASDGVHWVKPELDVVPGTNIVLQARRDSSTVWLDLEEKDPRRRFKFLYTPGHLKPARLHYSSDGIHWGEPAAESMPVADRTTFSRNPFRGVWVLSIREHTPGEVGPSRLKKPGEVSRFRLYREHRELEGALRWGSDQPVPWTGADRLDPRRVELNVQPELYNVDAVAYESLMLGLFSVWRGQPEVRPKINEIVLGYSRDGFHWRRPSRAPFIGVSEDSDAWNWGNMQSAGGGCLVVGDRLYFYASGRTTGSAGTGLFTLRRDGFASMDAGPDEGVLTTRPVRFRGRYLFVNSDTLGGELTAEVLDEKGRPIAPFVRANSLAVRADNTLQELQWRGVEDLSSLAGKPVKFRFHLRHGRLYAFWVSLDRSGASYGYVAAGGPGFTSAIDDAGAAAYEGCCTAEVRH